MKIGYTPGSFYKRFRLTTMQKMNRQAVRNYESALASAGSLMFNATAAQSQGSSELTAKQLLARLQQDATTRVSSLRNLGALMNITT